jgi:hypothetical protein
VRKVSACFRIYSEVLTPAEIAQHIGVPATEYWQRGDVRGGRSIQTHLWEFEIDYEEGETLDSVVSRTLQTLSPARDKIAGLAGVERIFWCAVFSDTPETTISLSLETLSGMATLRAELSCSIYAASFDDAPTSTPSASHSTH